MHLSITDIEKTDKKENPKIAPNENHKQAFAKRPISFLLAAKVFTSFFCSGIVMLLLIVLYYT